MPVRMWDSPEDAYKYILELEAKVHELSQKFKQKTNATPSTEDRNMRMSSHVVGFKSTHEKWNCMKAVWDACKKADVAIPEEVLDFFEDEAPENMPVPAIDITQAVTTWSGSCQGEHEIDVSKLPPAVRIIRVYASR